MPSRNILPLDRRAILALLFCGLSGPLLAQQHSGGKRTLKIAVMDLKAKGAEKDITSNVGDLVAGGVRDLNLGTVISGDDIRTMVEFSKKQAEFECDKLSCVAEIGGALGVDYLVSGSVGKLGSAYILTLQLVDVDHARVVAGVQKTLRGAVEEFIPTVQEAIKALFEKLEAGSAPSAPPPPSAGALSVESSQGGTSISLDGVAKGMTPSEGGSLRIEGVAPGSHRLRAAKEGFQDEEQTVEVSAGRTAEVALTLTPRAVELTVVTHPGESEVFVDDELLGTTPPGEEGLRARNLAPGRHTVRAEKEGYRAAAQTVVLRAGERRRTALTLTPGESGQRLGLVRPAPPLPPAAAAVARGPETPHNWIGFLAPGMSNVSNYNRSQLMAEAANFQIGLAGNATQFYLDLEVAQYSSSDDNNVAFNTLVPGLAGFGVRQVFSGAILYAALDGGYAQVEAKYEGTTVGPAPSDQESASVLSPLLGVDLRLGDSFTMGLAARYKMLFFQDESLSTEDLTLRWGWAF